MSGELIGRVDNLLRGVGLLVCAVLTAACGGGGGDDDGIHDSVLAAAFKGEEDHLGLFLPWKHFQNRCEAPRRMYEGGASEADKAGTVVDEKNFLRSYVNDTYLWYDEVEYPDPADNAHSVLEYFDLLRTRQETPSGRPKDPFSTTVPIGPALFTAVFSGYGFEDYSAILNGQIVVFDVEPDSPADRSGLSRGARILSINGRRYAPETDFIEFVYPFAGSFSGERGATFEVRDFGSNATRTFRMEVGTYPVDTVRYTQVIDTDTGPVGYLLFNSHEFSAEQELIGAFRDLAKAEVTDLVLDLRYNLGGFAEVAAEAAFMIAGHSATSGKVFLNFQLNDKHPTHDPISGDPIEPLYFSALARGLSAEPGTPLPSLNLNRVFILSTGLTCSASEALINGLRGIDIEVILIGDTTCGKPYGFRGIDNCGVIYLVVQDRALNHKGFGEYPDGFGAQNAPGPKSVSVPGCAVADDLGHALGDVDEALLAAALRYRADGSCPAPSRLAAKPVTTRSAPHHAGVTWMR